MNAAFYALNQAKPTLTVSHGSFFDVWTAMVAELAGYYGEDVESFRTIEASWSSDDEYAEFVTLNGRIVGALDRPLLQDDLAAIWGVNRMEKRALINRIRSLYNIDGDLLPELTREEQSKFLADPVRYFFDANDAQTDAIMREIEVRQNTAARADFAAADQTILEANKPPVTKAPRKKKSAPRVDGQRELLLPIKGGVDKSICRQKLPPVARLVEGDSSLAASEHPPCLSTLETRRHTRALLPIASAPKPRSTPDCPESAAAAGGNAAVPERAAMVGRPCRTRQPLAFR
jgi:hypothetical protein